MSESLKELSDRATQGEWHHCQPFQTVPTKHTVHGTVPSERVDYISTWAGLGTPRGHRVVVPMEGRESTMSSEDMAFVAELVSAYRRGELHDDTALATAVARARREALEGAARRVLEIEHESGELGIQNAQYVSDEILALCAATPPEARQTETGWKPMDTAPKEGAFLAVVDGDVRIVAHGKTSHVPLYGWVLVDQGPEDADLCEPTCWQPLPAPPPSAIGNLEGDAR
jgi:hypothetical protein